MFLYKLLFPRRLLLVLQQRQKRPEVHYASEMKTDLMWPIIWVRSPLDIGEIEVYII